MYFVDRQKIEQTLKYLETLIADMENAEPDSTVKKYAIERMVHMTIESILDVGNSMIDGFIMRDPGSYEDIIDILLDEKVISNDDSEGLKEVIKYRKNLVQNYLDIDHRQLVSVLQQNKVYVKDFPTKVRRYLDNELGPVSAFTN